MSLGDFLEAWQKTIKTCAAHTAPDGLIAFIVSPAEHTDSNRVVDLALLMYGLSEAQGLRCRRRVIALYNTQQANGQQVTWARTNKKLLKLYRDIVVLDRNRQLL
jgi:hypothetical protein